MEIPANIKSYLGVTNGRLTVIGFDGFDVKRNSKWICKCTCGKTKSITGYHIKKILSCGCWRAEATRARFTKHGCCKNPKERINLHARWSDMKRRCDPSYEQAHRYFHRGIKVCLEWHDFSVFKAHVDEKLGPCPIPTHKHSIDRIDNDRGYEPGNIRWATSKTQCRNTGSNHRIELNGEVKTIAEWAESIGVKDQIIRDRIRLGWSTKDALSTPKMRNGRKYIHLQPHEPL